MNIVKHKSDQYSNYNGDDSGSDIGLIEEKNDGKYKKDDSHKSSSKSIKSISDINSIDDSYSSKKSKERKEHPERYFTCDRPKIDIVNA